MKKPQRKSQSKPELTPEMVELFAELRSEYLATVPEKISAIQKYWTAHEREKLENEFHKMKGTGTTYGLPELTRMAALVEHLCRENSPKLGLAIFITLEILPKIAQHHTEGESYEMEQDPFFKKLSVLNAEVANRAS